MHKRVKKIRHRTIDLRKIARGEDDDDDFDEEERYPIQSQLPPPPQYTPIVSTNIPTSSSSSNLKKKRPGAKKEVPKLPILHEAVINCTKSYILFQENLSQIQKTQASLMSTMATIVSTSAALKPSLHSAQDSSSDDDTSDLSYDDTDDVTDTSSTTSASYPEVEDALPPCYDSAASGEDAYKVSLLSVKQILERGRVDVNEGDPRNGRRALHYAGSGELVKMLVEAGAVPDAVDGMGCTALHVMAENGLHKAARVVIEFCKKRFDEKRMREFVNMRSVTEGETALHLAVRIGNLQICSFLLSAHADLNMYIIFRFFSIF